MVQSDCMKYRLLFTLILVSGFLLSAGCITSKQSTGPVQTQAPAAPYASEIQKEVKQEAQKPSEEKTVEKPPSAVPLNKVDSASMAEGAPLMERAKDMDTFIKTSFPQVTDSYVSIKKSRNALEWKDVQDKALKLQILVQDFKKSYQLEVPNPEKTVFPDLNSRQQIVFLKYLRYLNDMESYATNLKNAVYYQEKGNDPQSAQTAGRYQNLADQFEKQAIAEVKTINDYATDFKYTFLDQKSAEQYRYVGQ